MTYTYAVLIERQHEARMPGERWCATIQGKLSTRYVFAMCRRSLHRKVNRTIRKIEADRNAVPEKIYITI